MQDFPKTIQPQNRTRTNSYFNILNNIIIIIIFCVLLDPRYLIDILCVWVYQWAFVCTCIHLEGCISTYLAYDGLLAGTTHPLGHGLHSQPVQVRLQAAQHVVKLVGLFRRAGRRALPLRLNLKYAAPNEKVINHNFSGWFENRFNRNRKVVDSMCIDLKAFFKHIWG